ARTVFAWADGDTVYAWDNVSLERTTLALTQVDGIVSGLRLSPDGERVAMLSGADGSPAQLRVLPLDGDPIYFAEPGVLLRAVGWASDDTLYFNTAVNEPPLALREQDDLWRLTVSSGVVEQVLEPGAGGAFRISPDGAFIAMSTAGTFAQDGTPDAEGVIRLYDTTTDTAEIALAFFPVATGSPVAFYPTFSWSPDSDAVFVAIPPVDGVYSDGEEDTLLWRLGVDGSTLQTGAVPASYFAPPRWNGDQTRLLYGAQDEFGMTPFVIAEGDGAAPDVLATGPGLRFRWAPSGERFLWRTDQSNGTFIGTPADPQRHALTLSPDIIQAQWIGPDALVRAVAGDDSIELEHVTVLDTEGGTLLYEGIATLPSDAPPTFSAVQIP
ncbi:MAG: LpqB family beta-propeller domain-containing protein, partial [Chloroflexota bacterium]